MAISRLQLEHFRNLSQVELSPDPGFNLISGANAAGKTSLLESIFYLSYGRSFRSSRVQQLIQHNHNYFRLISNLDQPARLIGIERNTSKQIIRVDRKPISRVSELSSLLPVLAIHPDSHQLITEGPDQRRHYMDWGVFHVEQRFLNAWKQYKTALNQRNAALRLKQSAKLCALWHAELATQASFIEHSRLSYLKRLKSFVQPLTDALFPQHTIELSYRRGWPSELSYEEYLQHHLAKDRDRGFTQAGPHRADLKITLNGLAAQTSISRGQQKKLVTLLKIAQLQLFTESAAKRCVLLFDDLPAELDEQNQERILSMLSSLDIQLFVTAIDADSFKHDYWTQGQMFHVEQGRIST